MHEGKYNKLNHYFEFFRGINWTGLDQFTSIRPNLIQMGPRARSLTDGHN